MREEIQRGVLGRELDLLALRGIEDLAGACLAMVRQARRRLWIASHALNPEIFERPEFVEAIRTLATTHPQSQIRILVADIQPILQNGHALVRVARRLPSILEIRRRDPADEELRSFLIADDAGHVLQPRWYDLQDAQASFGDRAWARRLAEDFVRAWELAEQDPNLRQLAL